MTYDNTNKGIISKNDRKESENHPDINGTINVEGKDFWISGWKKTRSSDGAPFYSLAVKPKQERAAEIRREAEGSGTYGGGSISRELDDEIPFFCEWR